MNSTKIIIFVSLLLTVLSLPSQATSHQKIESHNQSLLQQDSHQPTFTWLDQGQLTNHAYDALDFINASSHHGLNPAKYHAEELNKLDPSQDHAAAQRFEFLLSDGLIKLISDLKVGQLNASVADPDWFIPQQHFNAVEFLQQAVLQKHLKDQLNRLIPNTDDYRALIQALAQYQSYVDRGGWTTIPSSPLLRLGDKHPNIAAIRARLAYENPLLVITSQDTLTQYDNLLEHAVKNFQAKYGLKVDGIIGNDTLNAMNISAQQRVDQLKIALERRRWMPADLGQRYVLINLANYTLTAYDNGEKALSMKVIVGRKSRQTPSFTANLNHLVFHPYWHVPSKLAKLDLLPKQQADLNYFYLHDIRVFSRENGQKIEHDPYSIDWQTVSRSNFPYILRQEPGEHNALGQVKFMFQNPWGIYLHDTSHRELFSEAIRSFSSGCIRVEAPLALANFSLSNTPKETILDLIEKKENKGLKLNTVLPIYAVYFTVSFVEDEVRFSPDIYQRDKRIANLL